jgi:hypothetical protein
LHELVIEDLSDNVQAVAVNGGETDPSEQALATHQITSELISQVEVTVRCLIKLTPNLCDPFPDDLYFQSDAYPDVDIARGLFPSATPALISRLGRANWKRRQYLKTLEEKRKPGMPFAQGKSGTINRQKNAFLRQVATDAFNFRTPVALSVTGVTEVSAEDSIFTETGLKRNESVTSFGGISGIIKTRKPVPRLQLRVGHTMEPCM